MTDCVYCQNTFEMDETCSDGFRMWQGLTGPYYIPSVDDLGNLSWTNTGELPNPDPVNITGKGINIVGIVGSTDDLPDTANDFDAYLVGEEDPYNAYMWDGAAWVDLGIVGRGPQGEPGPAGPQVDPATVAPLMDGTAAVGSSAKYAREDHVHPHDTGLSAGRVNVISTRFHVDCVNGSDNDTGASGHAWRTLDKFFDMANNLKDGRADIRCYLDSPGTYTVGSSSEMSKTFTGMSFHITGGLDSSAAYDGNYIIRFLNTQETKFYCTHVNFRNVRIECPNSVADAIFSVDGGNFSVANCYIVPPVSLYGALGSITDTTVPSALVHGTNAVFNRVKTTSTTGNQITVTNGSNLFYGGSISEDSLLVSSTFPAFNVSYSKLHVAQGYPSALGTSLQTNNAVIVATNGRAGSWKSKAGTLTNTLWLTDDSPQSFVAGDTYTVSTAIAPVILTGSAKSFHFGFALPKSVTASTVTVTELTGAVRVPDGGYVSDGSVASSSSNWLTGSNVASYSASASNNYLYIAVAFTNTPTSGGNALTNNSFCVYEGSVKVTFS